MRRPTDHESGRRWFGRLPTRSKERIVDDRADGETLNGMYFCDVFDLDTTLDFRRGVRLGVTPGSADLGRGEPMTTPLAELGHPLLSGRFRTAKAVTDWAAWPLGTELLCRMTINIPGSRPIVGRLVYPNMSALLKSMGLEVVQ